MPVGLHDDRAENPADAPPALQQAGRGSSRPAASGSRTRGSRPCVGHGLLPVPVAPGGAGGGVLAPLGSDPHTRLGLDQFLQQPLGGPADEFKTICPTQRLTQAKQVVLGQGHRAPWSELPVHPGQLRGGLPVEQTADTSRRCTPGSRNPRTHVLPRTSGQEAQGRAGTSMPEGWTSRRSLWWRRFSWSKTHLPGASPRCQSNHRAAAPGWEELIAGERLGRTSSTDVPASGSARRGSGSCLGHCPVVRRVSPCARAVSASGARPTSAAGRRLDHAQLRGLVT